MSWDGRSRPATSWLPSSCWHSSRSYNRTWRRSGLRHSGAVHALSEEGRPSPGCIAVNELAHGRSRRSMRNSVFQNENICHLAALPSRSACRPSLRQRRKDAERPHNSSGIFERPGRSYELPGGQGSLGERCLRSSGNRSPRGRRVRSCVRCRAALSRSMQARSACEVRVLEVDLR
jgi:hypothetical protein